MTGVGKRAHLLQPGIDLETHIQDVSSTMDAEEMDNVVLVVHSYAGMIGTVVANRRPGRLRHLVYLDAVLPAPARAGAARMRPRRGLRASQRPRPILCSAFQHLTRLYSV